MKITDIVTCYICERPIEQRSFPNNLLKPAYFFLLACFCYSKKIFFFNSWRFFLGPILCFWNVNINSTPICRQCCRTLSFASIAVYVLLFAGIIACFIGWFMAGVSDGFRGFISTCHLSRVVFLRPCATLLCPVNRYAGSRSESECEMCNI